MEKGIIVIKEMPYKCKECPMFRHNGDYGYYCNQSQKFITDKEVIPLWCEIKPVPEYREEVLVHANGSTGEIKKENIGFNECLDEILKENTIKKCCGTCKYVHDDDGMLVCMNALNGNYKNVTYYWNECTRYRVRKQ